MQTSNTRLPKKILVPVDGSDSSERARSFALELSGQLHAQVVFLHVVELPRSAYKYRLPSDILEIFDEAGNEILARCAEKAKSRGIPSDTVLLHGDPATRILHETNEKNCDSIVLGRRGLGKFQRILLGSVSNKVSKLSPVPVIIVK